MSGARSGPDRIILALDTSDAAEALGWADLLHGLVGRFKVGLQLFTSAGPEVLRSLSERGLRVFLDLKLHDIPHTVERSVEGLGSYGVEMTTLHVSGGRRMLEAAAAARDRRAPDLRLLAVTVLTSLDAAGLAEVGIRGRPDDAAERLALLAASSGLDGAVCSPAEVARLRAACPPGFLLVTPGVRTADEARQDQARVASAADALAWGADYVVVGRPITRAADPSAAARRLAASLEVVS